MGRQGCHNPTGNHLPARAADDAHDEDEQANGADHPRENPLLGERGESINVAGKKIDDPCTPDTFATIKRTWNDGDKVEILAADVTARAADAG